MRRFPFFAFLAFSLMLPLAAVEIPVTGVLVPRDVYVGDEALLRADFYPPTPPDPPLVKGGALSPGERIELPLSPPLQGGAGGVWGVAGEISQDADGAYHLVLRFTPWEPGTFSFPPLTVPGTDLVLNIAPVTIASLSEKLGETQLRPAKPPAVVPGTTYLLLGGIAVLVLFLGAAAAALVKGDALRGAIAQRLGTLAFSRAGRRALRTFAALGKKGAAMNAPDFAALMEQHLRGYLEKRFRRPFTAMTAPELAAAFSSIFGTAADSFLDEQTARLGRIFLRCDFLRYSGSAVSPGFFVTEAQELIADGVSLVTVFEKGPDSQCGARPRPPR